MAIRSDEKFLEDLNANLGIAHKVSRMYFPDEAGRQDVFQEMMYQLWKSYETFDRRSRFSTWMYRVCLNTAMTYRRKYSDARDELLNFEHLQIADQPPDNSEHELHIMHQAIATLSDLNKAIILLYLDDLSYEEIADVTGLSKSNVSVRLVRIKKEIENIIKDKRS